MDPTLSLLIEKNITLAEVDIFASEVLDMLLRRRPKIGATVCGISGDLGAGKTTFSQSLARVLGVAEIVTSPTFVIQKRYTTTRPDFTSFIHMDAYRIEDARELRSLDIENILSSEHSLVVVEWVERMHAALKETLHIDFIVVGDGVRNVKVFGIHND
jgi:tRNA threonylcarbamoyladenosine biosynthesis protein TsaE